MSTMKNFDGVVVESPVSYSSNIFTRERAAVNEIKTGFSTASGNQGKLEGIFPVRENSGEFGNFLADLNGV